MPRAGLGRASVISGAADLADQVGLVNVTTGLLATHLGVKAPSLYKHVGGLDDVRRGVAALALVQLGETLVAAVDGRSGREALAAAAGAIRRFALEHPGRYSATIRVPIEGPDDPLVGVSARVLDTLAGVLSDYGIEPGQDVHALRMLRSLLHGFAVIEAAGGFQMDTGVDDSFAWIVDFVDGGLKQVGRGAQAGETKPSQPASR